MGLMDLFNKAKSKAQDPETQEKVKRAAMEQARKRQTGQRPGSGVRPVTPPPYYGGMNTPYGSSFLDTNVSGDYDGDGVPDYLEQNYQAPPEQTQGGLYDPNNDVPVIPNDAPIVDDGYTDPDASDDPGTDYPDQGSDSFDSGDSGYDTGSDSSYDSGDSGSDSFDSGGGYDSGGGFDSGGSDY